MTSIATVMGAVPLVMMGGAGAESRASIGVEIVSGVSLATLITLFLLPILYSRLAGRTVSPQTVGRELDDALEAPTPAEGVDHCGGKGKRKRDRRRKRVSVGEQLVGV